MKSTRANCAEEDAERRSFGSSVVPCFFGHGRIVEHYSKDGDPVVMFILGDMRVFWSLGMISVIQIFSVIRT